MDAGLPRDICGSLCSRREFIVCAGGLVAILGSGRFGWAVITASDDANTRKQALRLLRIADLNPAWFTSANWANAAYKPWTDYLAAKSSETEFSHVCAKPSDYCLRDVWNLRKEEPHKIDWSSSMPVNWHGIHALALRFFRTGDPIYLRKWVAVVDDYAAWARTDRSPENAQIKKGTPGALLQAAETWSGIFTALAIIAKGLGMASRKGDREKKSPYAPVDEPVNQSELDLMPADTIVRIARSFAEGQAVDLVRYYSRPNYVPNQRMAGLEAVAYLLAFFSDVPGVRALAAPLHNALMDVLVRYRLPDGGQLEQSFNYAQSLVFGAMRVAKLPFQDAPPWRDEASMTIKGWQRIGAALISPVGGLPQVGNTVWGRLEKFSSDVKFDATSMAFPYSGFYVMRTSWAPDAAYLFYFYRRDARGHSMAGCNSIQVAAYGRQLLIAGGSAKYTGKSAAYPQSVAYLAETSSFKTNTIIVDGRSQNGGSRQGLPRDSTGKPDNTRAPTIPLKSRWHSSAEFDYVDGLYGEGYKGSLDDPAASLVDGVEHYRQIVFVRALMLWVVVDVMKTYGAHRYTQIWKFAAPKNGLAVPGFSKEQVVLRPGEHTVRTEDRSGFAVNVSLQQFGIDGLAYRSYFGEGPYGYVGPGSLSEAVPAVDVHAMWEGKGPQVLITVITPYRGLVSPVKSAANRSKVGQAACELAMRDGSTLSVAASDAPQRLSAGGKDVNDGELLLALERPGKTKSGIVISEKLSYEFNGERQTPITVPSGFRWTTAGDGQLTPVY